MGSVVPILEIIDRFTNALIFQLCQIAAARRAREEDVEDVGAGAFHRPARPLSASTIIWSRSAPRSRAWPSSSAVRAVLSYAPRAGPDRVVPPLRRIRPDRARRTRAAAHTSQMLRWPSAVPRSRLRVRGWRRSHGGWRHPCPAEGVILAPSLRPSAVPRVPKAARRTLWCCCCIARWARVLVGASSSKLCGARANTCSSVGTSACSRRLA